MTAEAFCIRRTPSLSLRSHPRLYLVLPTPQIWQRLLPSPISLNQKPPSSLFPSPSKFFSTQVVNQKKRIVIMANQSRPKPSKLSIYLYVPNIIGYIRVLMNCFAFAICYSNKWLFGVLYFISFVCDGIDGWCARKLNQASTFGAVLDMVTDRISTACLLVLLSQVYRPSLIFVGLLALDIGSHWLQMYSTFLVGKGSHKDVKDSSNWLFRAYYRSRMLMAYCCVACEVLYIILFLLAKKQNENLMDVLITSIKEGSSVSFLIGVSLFGCMLKQVINFIQLKAAADTCVLYDITRKEKQ